jgi:hypothetical protein
MIGALSSVYLSEREYRLLSRHAKNPREVEAVETQSNVFRSRLYRASCSDYLRQLDGETLRAKLHSLLSKLSQPKNRFGLATVEHAGYHYYDDLLVRVRAYQQGLAEQRLLYYKRYQSLIVFESSLFSIPAKEHVARVLRRLSVWEAWRMRKLAAQIGYYFRYYVYLVGMYDEETYDRRASSSTEFHLYSHHENMWQDMKNQAQMDWGFRDRINPDYKN